MTTLEGRSWLDERSIARDVINRYYRLRRNGTDIAAAAASAVEGAEDTAIAEEAVTVYQKNLDAGRDGLDAILSSVTEAVPHPSHDAEERWAAPTASGSADESSAVPEGFDSVEDVFDNGYCHGLALALHERTGWPIVRLQLDGDDLHYLVRRPDGMLVDAHGARPEAEVKLTWAEGEARFVQRYSVRDYDADNVWGLVRRGDMEDPNDVRDLARHVIAERGLAAADEATPARQQTEQRHERALGDAVENINEHAQQPADADAEVVVIDPAELMPAEDALRNYDVAAEAVDRFSRTAGNGWTDDEAVAWAVAATEDETGLAADAVAEYRRQRAAGIGHEAARSAAVVGVADRYSPRVSAEQAQQIAAAFAEPVVGEPPVESTDAQPGAFALGDVVRNRRTGEVLTVTGDPADWDSYDYERADTADGAGIPEREPQPGSWVARNLPGTSSSNAGVGMATHDAAFEAAERARVWDAVNSLPAGVVTDADLEQAGITRDEFNRVGRRQAARVHAEENAQRDAEQQRVSAAAAEPSTRSDEPATRVRAQSDRAEGSGRLSDTTYVDRGTINERFDGFRAAGTVAVTAARDALGDSPSAAFVTARVERMVADGYEPDLAFRVSVEAEVPNPAVTQDAVRVQRARSRSAREAADAAADADDVSAAIASGDHGPRRQGPAADSDADTVQVPTGSVAALEETRRGTDEVLDRIDVLLDNRLRRLLGKRAAAPGQAVQAAEEAAARVPEAAHSTENEDTAARVQAEDLAQPDAERERTTAPPAASASGSGSDSWIDRNLAVRFPDFDDSAEAAESRSSARSEQYERALQAWRQLYAEADQTATAPAPSSAPQPRARMMQGPNFAFGMTEDEFRATNPEAVVSTPGQPIVLSVDDDLGVTDAVDQAQAATVASQGPVRPDGTRDRSSRTVPVEGLLNFGTFTVRGGVVMGSAARGAAREDTARGAAREGTGRDAQDVLGRIDEVLAEDDGEPPLAARVTASGQAVEAAQAAAHRAEITDEDTTRSERCARWNSDDAAAGAADDSTDGWGQG